MKLATLLMDFRHKTVETGDVRMCSNINDGRNGTTYEVLGRSATKGFFQVKILCSSESTYKESVGDVLDWMEDTIGYDCLVTRDPNV